MEKLELKDIAGYLPYRVLFKTKSSTENASIGGLSTKLIDIDIEDIILLLRPISDLYKTIEHKGKEIIPLVEMAYMIRPVLDWSFNESKKAAKTACGWRLTYDEGFYLIEEQDDVRLRKIDNQHKLYDFLDELHIDYRGLIERGLAIDINTL